MKPLLMPIGWAALALTAGCGASAAQLNTDRYDQAILDDGPLVYYPLNEATGTLFHDRSGHAQNATAKGGLSLTEQGAFSQTDQSVGFDGKSGWIQSAARQTNVAAYTVEVWFSTTDTFPQFARAFVQDRGVGSGRSLTLGIGGDGKTFFALDSDGILVGAWSSLPSNDGHWHHLVGTWQMKPGTAVAPDQFSLYVDGAFTAVNTVAKGDPEMPPLTGSGPIKIGRHDAWDTYYRGNLERVAVYTKALSASEILHHYNLGLINS